MGQMFALLDQPLKISDKPHASCPLPGLRRRVTLIMCALAMMTDREILNGRVDRGKPGRKVGIVALPDRVNLSSGPVVVSGSMSGKAGALRRRWQACAT